MSRLASPFHSRVTIHMAASLDGFIARKDGSVDWLETADEFAAGETMEPGFVEAFLKTIDCYVMGSRTYETALGFEAQGLGWAYGDKPTFVLTHRELPRTRDNVEFHSGDLAQFVNGRLRPTFRNIWFVGGGAVCGECLRLGLADEVHYSIVPIVIGDGISFFEKLDRDVALHLAEVKAYQSGMVELRYQVQRGNPKSQNPSQVNPKREGIGMIIYSVTITIQAGIEAEWIEWMKKVHIPDVLRTGCFSECRIHKVLGSESAEPVYVMQYHCRSVEEYHRYRDNFAPALQKDHTDRFAGKFHGSRQLLEEIARLEPTSGA